MILYNVTINVDEPYIAEWLQWMKSKHIPDVMNTGMFSHSRILKLLNKQEDELGETFAVQYECESMEKYEHYQQHFAPALQADTQKNFGGHFAAFRTLLETV